MNPKTYIEETLHSAKPESKLCNSLNVPFQAFALHSAKPESKQENQFDYLLTLAALHSAKPESKLNIASQ